MKPAAGWFDALPKDRLLAEFSLWSADLARVADDIARVDQHVDIYHVDVADGHFSPALLYFPDLLAAVRKLTRKPLHVHLMVDDRILLAQIEQFAEAGADLISIHAENLPAGVVLQLATPVEAAEDLLPRISLLTLLGTGIGVKGQGLDPEAPGRIAAARRLVAASGFPVRVAADGGIREHTVPELRAHGAETIVMGSLAFGAPDLAARISWVHAQPHGG